MYLFERHHAKPSSAMVRMPSQPALQPELVARRRPVFEYVGSTALTVVAPRSGSCYYFNYPGAMLAVDPSDFDVLLGIRSLRVRREI